MNKDGRQEIVLALIVRVDRLFREFCALGNVIDAGAGEAGPPETLICRVYNALPSLLRFDAHSCLRPKVY
jgi:hypothetical protein